jgi:hypothetical protein
LRKRTLCRLAALLLAFAAVACTNGNATLGPTYFQPARITVRDFSADPAQATLGTPVHITFRLVREGGDTAPIYWTAHLVERPSEGGTLSRLSGGPLASGATVELDYQAPDAATVAYLSIFPSSVSGTDTGDGTGDWLTMPITVH